MINPIRSEFMKFRTTHIWWIFALSTFVVTALAFTVWSLEAHTELNAQPMQDSTPPPGMDAEEWERIREEENARINEARTAAELAKTAANIYTSGQFFGLMFVMVLGILLVTNEFYHQTATATFLTTPKRTIVIMAKLVAAVIIGFVFWLFTTVINVGAGVLFFASEEVTNSLGEWEVHRGLLLNLLAYALWAIFGVGLGVLIRSQIGATITATVAYTLGTFVVINILGVLYYVTDQKHEWIMQSAVFVPSLASQHMITGLELGSDIDILPRWVGAVVLIGWALVAGVIGTLITRTRDIS